MRMVMMLARIGAIAIAVLGVLDPAITSRRGARPAVALAHEGIADDDALLAEVRRALDSRFRVTTPGGAEAVATVVVGDRIPRTAATVTGPVVAVVPGGGAPSLAFERLALPRMASLGSRIEAGVEVRARGLGGDSVRLTLHDGALAVAETTVAVASDDARLRATLSVIASDATPRRLAVRGVAVKARGASAAAEGVVAVVSAPWPVLSFDARPSWMATFVRRALERDPRFVVSSRMLASRGVGVAAGAAPTSLADAEALTPYAAVVVGAPGALDQGALAGLDRYLRAGGRVILLADEAGDAPWRRLLGAVAWRHDSGGRVLTVTGTDAGSTVMRASAIGWPTALAPGAEVVAAIREGDASRPVVWRQPVGAGELVVSGALDAWQFRDAGFERFWGAVVADAAASNPGALSVTVERPLLALGDSSRVEVMLRSATEVDAAGNSSGTVSVVLTRDGGASVDLRLWPGPMRGSFVGVAHATAVGTYQLTVQGGGATVTTPMVVDSAVAMARPTSDDLLSRWVMASGGELLGAQAVDRLPAVLAARFEAAIAPSRWHPMRSPWWLVPFALLLSVEWWSRRRRGAP